MHVAAHAHGAAGAIIVLAGLDLDVLRDALPLAATRHPLRSIITVM
jgi:hypothetical protein